MKTNPSQYKSVVVLILTPPSHPFLVFFMNMVKKINKRLLNF